MKNLALSVLKIFLIVSIASAQSGVLIPSPNEKPDPKILSLAVMSVDILIDNQHATVKVMQIFDNHTTSTLEGKYIFALPHLASISDFAVWDSDLRIPGVMMEKRRAGEIYGDIKRKEADPGLLQSTDGPGDGGGDAGFASGFSAKIVPINAYGTKRLEMEYTEELPVEGLASHFTFPLKPSYGEEQTVGELNLKIHVLSDIPISPIIAEQTPYPLQVTTNQPNEFAGEFHAANVQLGDDLAFDYKLGTGDNSFSVITHREPEAVSTYDLRDPKLANPNPDGFFQARAIFKTAENVQPPPRRVILLLDTSLSMYGDKLTRAVEAADQFLHGLTPADEFGLILFNEDTTEFSPKPVAATPDAIEQAMQFIRSSSLGGGTNVKKALEKSVELAKLFSGGEPSIVMVSDANPTLGTTKTKEIAAALDKNNARFFAFALGVDANELLLKKLTAKTHGAFDQACETEDIALKLQLFFAKVGMPDVADLKLSSANLDNLYDIYPSGDNSYSGSSISFIGRYRKPQTQTISFSARRGTENIAMSQDVALPDLEAAHAQLPRVWARARVDALLAAMNRDGEREDYIAEIIRLSEEYKFVTPYTAFIAAPRALIRPRLIQPGDPVIRIKTDPSVTEAFAVLPFGQTVPLKFLPGDGVWETRFLAPSWMADGTYTCRLLLTDKDGNGYQEEKSFVIDSRAPAVQIELDKQSFSAGEDLRVKVLADSDTTRLTAKLYGAKPVQLRWSGSDKANVGVLRIPETLASGRYTVTVSAEDFAHNQTTEDMTIEVIGK
ncbi:MAG TPA: VIT domain-containing protein [Pyrinomonadaceae bacterium]|nr:VIT domain-containing protein [Pyrinomonadaceae bacterium]